MYEHTEGYPRIMFFSSTHCAPCRTVEEMLKRINVSMFGKKLYIEKINIEEKANFKMTQEYSITSVPTLLIAEKRLNVDVQEEGIIDAILNGFISSIEL